MKIETKYKEIFRLKEMLDKENIQYEFFDNCCKDEALKSITGNYFEHYQICLPGKTEDRYLSVIQGFR